MGENKDFEIVLDGIKLNAIFSKGNYKQGEKTTLRMGKIITTNETTDKGLISKLYKELDFHLIQRRIPNRTIKIQNGMSGDLRVFPRLEMVLRVIKHQPDGK